jgi:enoyl-CoA hydratase
MAFENIALNTEPDGIAILTFNRPAKLNALNQAMLREIESALSIVWSDPAVRGLILTGAGEKSFIAGADISELAAGSPSRCCELSRFGQEIFRHLETGGKPSIAAINGFALGGGLELAMACTLRVAAANARMGQPEVKLGLIAGYGGTQRLPRLVGRGRALELLLTGEPVDAAEAHRIGLVNHVVEGEQLMDFCRGLMRKIFANAPAAVRLTLQAVDVGLDAGLSEGLQFEAAAFGLISSTRDFGEGTSAFLEKRKPQFTGK